MLMTIAIVALGYITHLYVLKTEPPSVISSPMLPLYNWNISPEGIINATQGSTQEITLTFTSILDNRQTLIPIENLTLTYYNSHIDYSNWGTNNSLNFPQDRCFNYSFSQTQLMLQPLASNSTILTIKIANDAPIGMYAFFINLGKVTANSESQINSALALQLAMAVTNPSDST
jgi:aminopeptidase-like protein